MNKVILAFVMVFAFIFAGCIGGNPPAGNGNEPVACTMEAKMCPDGSAVGRTGPNCEFAPCPGEGASPGGSTECGECPMYAPPAPGFCSGGTIVAGEVDECGCRGHPTCACTEEAKVCGDGSAVGRVPPDCEFAPCPNENGAETLSSNEWRLTRIDDEEFTDNPVHIKFEGSSFSGNAGCNNMGGSYSVNGDQIEFGQTAITLMYCEDTADLETKVIQKMGGGPYTWEISDGKLNFYKGEALVMSWEKYTE